MKIRLFAVSIIILGCAAGYFVYPKWGIWEKIHIPFRLGLDLKGGMHLVYRADVSTIPSAEQNDAMEGLRDVIERRVNFFGVSEPVVRVEYAGGESRLDVELAGILDQQEAIRLIGETPYLEFREEGIIPVGTTTQPGFVPTLLTGRFLKKASVEFNQTTGVPVVNLSFNEEGSKLFEELTAANINKRLAIYLDGAPISAPVVREKISGGNAQISGGDQGFDPNEAKLLSQRLNSGALPVPIELISQERIEPAKGEEALKKSFFAGILGFIFVVAFMLLWYRLPGLVAVLALGIYVALSLTVFKLIPVTFTTAGIAGFILSIGMAVDANILIFERMKEEVRRGKMLAGAIEEGFVRAWTSIRDSNASSMITALILWYFGSATVKGFALTLGIGVAISMFSAITVTRTFLRAFHSRKRTSAGFLYGSGLGKKL